MGKNWIYKERSALAWWDSISIEEKVSIKEKFEAFRKKNELKRYPLPCIYDLRHIRISKLANKHIARIYVFKDRI